MKISLLAISIILALQATTLLYNSQPRYVFHNTIHEISQLVKPITSTFMQPQAGACCNCFLADEEFRYGFISFMYASALLLFVGDAVWPAFISQIFWIVFQSYLCTDRSLGNIRNFAVQVLILYVLATNLKCCGTSQSCVSSEQNKVLPKQSIITSRTDSVESEQGRTVIQKQEKPKQGTKNKKNK